MGDINFYLRPVQAKTGKALIQLQFRYNGQRLRWSWGDAIAPINWNNEKQRVKSNKETRETGEFHINDLLDNLERVINTTYQAEKAKGGIPTENTLKKALNDFYNRSLNKAQEDSSKPTFFSLLDRFVNGEIMKRGKDIKINTLKNYATARGHLLEFQREMKYPVDFETINLDFFDKLVLFLKKRKVHKYTKEKGLSQNSIAKTVAIVKTVMNRALLLKYTTNMDFKNPDFYVPEVAPDAVYLSDEEVMKFYKHDFSDNPRLERVRDLFVFGCFVGLRISDFNNVKPENIVQIDGDPYIKIRTKKTEELVFIPCSPIVKQIFKKYDKNDNKLPDSISDQKFNEYLQEAAEIAGFTEKGRLNEKPDLALWECISSHTARRSFCTNLYLQGFPTFEIMKISGHRTELSFKKYIRNDKLNSAKRLNEHFKQNWSKITLKVAS